MWPSTHLLTNDCTVLMSYRRPRSLGEILFSIERNNFCCIVRWYNERKLDGLSLICHLTKQSFKETLQKACFDMKWICLLKEYFMQYANFMHPTTCFHILCILFWICYIEFVSFWGMVYGARDIYATYIKLGLYIHNIHFCL